MKKVLAVLGTKIINQNVKKEADNVCGFMGYQPKMPEAVRKMRKEKK